MQPLSPGFHLLRAFVYAGTSLAALLAGAMSQPLPLDWREVLVLLAFWGGSLHFFAAYAICFDYQERVDPTLAAIARREALWAAFILALCFSFAFLPHHRESPGLRLHIVVLLVYGLLFVAYGYWLFRTYASDPRPPARHQIAWPSLLSIGVAFFIGSNIVRTHESGSFLIWIAALIAYSLAAEKFFVNYGNSRWPKRLLVILSLGIYCGLGLLILLSRIGKLALPEQFVLQGSLMLFGIAIAAYLASFEAWRMTADVTKRQSMLAGQREDDIAISMGGEYHLATSMSLIIALVVTPILYVVGNFGTIFIVGFVLHGSVAFVYWISRKDSHLRTGNWARRKTFFGMLLLLILVMDAAWPLTINSPLLGAASTIELFYGLAVGMPPLLMLARPIAVQLRRVKKERVKPGQFVLRLFLKRRYLVLLFNLMAALGLGLLVFFREALVGIDEGLAARTEHAMASYFVYLIVSWIVVAVDWSGGLPKYWSRLPATIVAVSLLVRVPTCLLIAVVAAWPLRGRDDFLTAIWLEALPFAVIAAAGFALNDRHDVRQDAINKPWRPIARGLIPREWANRWAVVLTAIGIGLGLFSGDANALSWQLAASFGVWLYPSVVRHCGWGKGALAALISLTPVAAGFGMTLGTAVGSSLFVGGGLFIWGREILMDVRDIPGDRVAGITTLPVVANRGAAIALAVALQGLGLFLALTTEPELWGIAIATVGVALLCLAIYGLIRQRRIYFETAVLGMWMPILIAVLSASS